MLIILVSILAVHMSHSFQTNYIKFFWSLSIGILKKLHNVQLDDVCSIWMWECRFIDWSSESVDLDVLLFSMYVSDLEELSIGHTANDMELHKIAS